MSHSFPEALYFTFGVIGLFLCCWVMFHCTCVFSFSERWGHIGSGLGSVGGRIGGRGGGVMAVKCHCFENVMM